MRLTEDWSKGSLESKQVLITKTCQLTTDNERSDDDACWCCPHCSSPKSCFQSTNYVKQLGFWSIPKNGTIFWCRPLYISGGLKHFWSEGNMFIVLTPEKPKHPLKDRVPGLVGLIRWSISYFLSEILIKRWTWKSRDGIWAPQRPHPYWVPAQPFLLGQPTILTGSPNISYWVSQREFTLIIQPLVV